MEVALTESPDYTECRVDQKHDYLFDETRAHFRATIMIVNNSRTPLYARTKDGQVHHIPQRLINNNYNSDPAVYVEVKYISRKINRREEVKTHRYKLNPTKLAKGCATYMKEWGIYVSPDSSLLENMPTVEDTQIEDRIRASIQSALANMAQCPISIIINDPSRELRYVFGVLDEQIYKIPVLHTRSLSKTCIVRFSAVDDADSDSIFDFSLDELAQEFSEHQRFCPRVGSYKFELFPTLETAQDRVTAIRSEITKRSLGMSAREKEAARLEVAELIKDKDRTIADLNIEVNQLKRTIAILETVVKQGEAATSREHARDILDLKGKVEQTKVQKAQYDVNASSLGYSTTALKTAAVVTPVIVGCIGLAATKMVVPAFAGVGIWRMMSTLFPSVTAGCATVFAGIGSAIGSIGSSVCKGVKSLCGWVSQWF